VKTSERIYRLLLRLYPRDFGDEYGAEMARLYRDRARDEGALRLWLALLADVLRTAPKEQLNMLMQDIRHAFRLFSRTPIVTATGLITVALGVGGSTAVFSVVYAVMMRPLPYPAPDRIVELFEDNPQANRPLFRVSTLNYLSWAERATSMEALAAFGSAGFTLTDHGEPERLSGGAITASMFSVLGLPPLAGRGFRTEDERPGAQRVALIAEALWRRRFGGDPAIVGQTITLTVNVVRSSVSCPARSARRDGRRLIPPEAARRSSCRSPLIQRARVVAIASSALSAGCVLASPWIAQLMRCAASPPPLSRSSPPRTKAGACD